MRELTGLLLAIIVAAGIAIGNQDRIRDWIVGRAAINGGAAMTGFVAAARDYLDAEYDGFSTLAVGGTRQVQVAALQTAGYLPAGWQDRSWNGQRHALVVRRQSADNLLALAYTHGGRPLNEHAMMLAAAAGQGLGYLSAEDGYETRVVSAAGDWEVTRTDFSGGPALENGRLGALLFAHKGRVLGPWLCRAHIPGRPECNELTAALRVSPATLPTGFTAALEVTAPAGETALELTGISHFDGAVGIGREADTTAILAVEGDSLFNGSMTVDGLATFQANAAFNGSVSGEAFRHLSDPRVKRDLTVLTCTPDLSARLSQIRPYRWIWRRNGEPGVGYNAAEVEAVLPDLVHHDERGVRHLDYAGLSALKQACAGAAARGSTRSLWLAEARRAGGSP